VDLYGAYDANDLEAGKTFNFDRGMSLRHGVANRHRGVLFAKFLGERLEDLEHRSDVRAKPRRGQ
jgi:hypothetical protein